MTDLIDLRIPCAPGSLMRSCPLDRSGKFRLARRDAELYSVQIVSSGAWGRVVVTNGLGRMLWMQPSTFTGSFVLGAECEEGLIVELASMDAAAHVVVNFRERDTALV